MNQFKRAQVIMLPTKDNHSQLEIDDLSINKLSWELKQYCHKHPQHLYIISDDEIKEGDWHLNADKNVVTNTTRYTLYKATKIKLDFIKKLQEKNSDCKFYKIIATTDTSLTIKHKYSPYLRDWNLPQPSQQFIEKYIEEYNNGDIITDVLVEYESKFETIQEGLPGFPEDNISWWNNKIKVNSKDNTIVIKKLKDSWNRGEVIEQMWSAYKAANTVFEDESALRIEFDNWINQNL